ncbi:unnamed protein product [Brassica oleracea]
MVCSWWLFSSTLHILIWSMGNLTRTAKLDVATSQFSTLLELLQVVTMLTILVSNSPVTTKRSYYLDVTLK